jgi:hypothetical protein
LLRLYQELRAIRPEWSITFFGDAAARSYDGPLPEGVKI